MKQWTLSVCAVLAVSVTTITAAATTYVVNPDGTGDFPTIQAAIDAATDGDLIQLTDGTFVGDGNRDLSLRGKAITVFSQCGDPTECVIDCDGSPAQPHRGFIIDSGEGEESILQGLTITGAYANEPGGAVRILYAKPTIRDCIFSNSISTHGGGVYCGGDPGPSFVMCLFLGNEATVRGGGLDCHFYAYVRVSNCTFSDNTSPSGCAIGSRLATPIVDRSILAFGRGGSAVFCDQSDPYLACCDVYGNEGGDWVGCISDQEDTSYNFSSNPRFCGIDEEDRTLFSDSPCLPESTPCGQLVGARDQGCPELPSGACCLGDGSCLLETARICDLLMGYFHGDDTVCDPNPCDQIGACCLPNNSCLIVDDDTCYDSNGTFHGVGTGCDPCPCPPIVVHADGTGDFESIQAAIDAGSNGQEIILTDGIFVGPGNRGIEFRGKSLTLHSESGNPETCVIDCEGLGRGLYFRASEGPATVVEAITISNGGLESGGGAGIACSGSSPTISRCIVSSNGVVSERGGIYVLSGSPEIAECTVSENSGHGISLDSGSATIRDCSIIGNTGAGIVLDRCFPTVSGCTVTGNRGGGISCISSSSTLQNCTIASNRSSAFGGGVLIAGEAGEPSWLTLERTILRGNCAASGREMFLADSYSGASFLCCAVDETGVAGFGVVDYIGEQVAANPLFCSAVSCVEAPTADGTYTLMGDSPCLPENSPCGELIGSLGEGCTASGLDDDGTEERTDRIEQVGLGTPAPNPVADRLMFSVGLPQAARARVTVFDVSGRAIVQVLDRQLPEGLHGIEWSPVTRSGQRLAGGVYYLRLNASGRELIRRFVVVGE